MSKVPCCLINLVTYKTFLLIERGKSIVPIISAATIHTAVNEAIISQPITPQVENILNRYVLNVIAKQPANLQAAHNDFLTTLRNDKTIPQNVRFATELRLNRIFFLFNGLRDNRTAFDAGLAASDNNISNFLQTPQAQQLNQQYRQVAERLRRIVSEDAFGALLPYASPRPIHTVPN